VQSRPHRVQVLLSLELGHSPALMVACGFAHTMLLTADGEVYTCGLGSDGANQTCLTLVNPTLFGTSAPICMIAASHSHGMALGSNDKLLWTGGNNRRGQLSHGTHGIVVDVPTLVPTARFDGAVVESMSGGGDHSLAVTVDSVLWACGDDDRGALRLGIIVACNAFHRVGGEDVFDGQSVRLAVAGRSHLLVVTKDSTVWMCGHDALSGLPKSIPVNMFRFTRLDTAYPTFHNNFAVVAAGSDHCAGVTQDGVLHTWSTTTTLKGQGTYYTDRGLLQQQFSRPIPYVLETQLVSLMTPLVKQS